jgi:hypothetical protein
MKNNYMKDISPSILASKSWPLRELPGFGTLAYSPGVAASAPLSP